VTYQGLEAHLKPRVQTTKLCFVVCTPFVLSTVNGIISRISNKKNKKNIPGFEMQLRLEPPRSRLPLLCCLPSSLPPFMVVVVMFG
jgi:hypothetical protein